MLRGEEQAVRFNRHHSEGRVCVTATREVHASHSTSASASSASRAAHLCPALASCACAFNR